MGWWERTTSPPPFRSLPPAIGACKFVCPSNKKKKNQDTFVSLFSLKISFSHARARPSTGVPALPSMASPPQQYVAAVVGSTGATGAALLQALANSQRFSKIVSIARSPASTSSAAEKIIAPVKLDLDQLADFALAEKIALTVVGPESSLAAGAVDIFRAKGLPEVADFLGPRAHAFEPKVA